MQICFVKCSGNKKSRKKEAVFFLFLKIKKPLFIFLQETYSDLSDESLWKMNGVVK